MRKQLLATSFLCTAVLSGCSQEDIQKDVEESVPALQIDTQEERTVPSSTRRVDFSKLHPSFRFSAEIPSAWEVEFVPAINAVNVYDPNDAAVTIRERSQVFIRLFEADRFLTLSTVNVLEREEVTVQGHSAVRYEIEKKAGVSDFPHQPSWRSQRHQLTDVRFTEASPSLFFVFSYRPDLPDDVFETFLKSLRFHNDPKGFTAPLARLSERPVLKPFGLKVTPGSSPIQPERFSGYHTGVDLEVFEAEKDQAVNVTAMCGGTLRVKKIVEGYGGVMVQECLLRDDPITVVYGHLDLGSINASVGDYVPPGDLLGELGEPGPETDGERKHLHIGIHRGREVVLAGYVDREEKIVDWIDPLSLLTSE